MSAFKPASFAERQNAALTARKAALENFRSKAAADVLAFPQRQETLKAVRIARDFRAADRQATRVTRAAEIADQAVREREAAAQTERDAVTERVEESRRELARQAEGKAARDARYAARKARQ